jgi:hypothetical protein
MNKKERGDRRDFIVLAYVLNRPFASSVMVARPLGEDEGLMCTFGYLAIVTPI